MPLRRIVGERQRDRAGGRDRGVVREARADLGQLVHQLRRDLGDALHVAAVLRVQQAARRSWRPASSRRAPSPGRLRSISLVTVNSSFMIGAGPFSRASSSAASQPATAISRETSSVNCTDSGEPYFIFSSVMVLPRPRKPMPWRRLRRISSRCCSSGRPLISTTLSSMRVNTFTTSRYSSQSNSREVGERMRTKRVRFTEPSRHAAVRRQTAARRTGWWRGCSRTTSCCSSR